MVIGKTVTREYVKIRISGLDSLNAKKASGYVWKT